MKDRNFVHLVGYVGHKPETSADNRRVSFALATNQVWQDANGAKQIRTTWHSIVCWSLIADQVCELMNNGLLDKGSRVMVTGEMRLYEWKREDGTTDSRTDIIADGVAVYPRVRIKMEQDENRG